MYIFDIDAVYSDIIFGKPFKVWYREDADVGLGDGEDGVFCG